MPPAPPTDDNDGDSFPTLGALALWRAELAAGLHGQRADTPSTWRVSDPLHRAACYEAAALDCYRAGGNPTRLLAKAAAVLVAAAPAPLPSARKAA